MPLFRLRVLAHQRTDLSEDDVSWSWGVEHAGPDSQDLIPLFEDFQLAMVNGGAGGQLGPYMQPLMDFYAIEVYPAAGGEAVAVGGFSPEYRPQGVGTPEVSEVAICVSQNIATVRGVRPRGRTYYGPFATSAFNDGRPAANAILACLNFAEAWHDSLVAEGFTPVVISANGLVNRGPVLSYQVDNAADTQRRRGWERSSITVRAV